MEENLPSTTKTIFSDPNMLSEFRLIVCPNEDSLWRDGKFEFLITISEDYNMIPPKVKCITKILHPNISSKLSVYFSLKSKMWNQNYLFKQTTIELVFLATGDVCLSLLRLNSIDGMGWLPTRRLKDVVFGINSLFTDLCDFDDPLNIELSEEYAKNSEKVKQKIRDFTLQHAMR